MKRTKPTSVALIIAALSLFLSAATATAAEPPKPLHALLVIGGGFHDYAKQKDILKAGIEERAHVQVDVAYVPAANNATATRFDAYAKPDWAKDYDVVIHDECSEAVRETNYVQNILNAHKTVPAVNLHCAMHCYRWGNFRQPVQPGSDNSAWFEMLGLQSTGHGPQEPIDISFVDAAHPITKGLENWTTIREELYNNIKVFDTAHILARGKQTVKRRDGTTGDAEAAVVWINKYGSARVFNTTLGHNNDTVADPRYLDLVTRGLLWSCDKLNDTYLKPAPKKSAAMRESMHAIALSENTAGWDAFVSASFEGDDTCCGR